eukprot:SM000205S06215  [mRNA]  locus=s205:13968:16331:- [translate_table: standard]
MSAFGGFSFGGAQMAAPATPSPAAAAARQVHLATKDAAPAAYGTKWDNLHPDSQKLLLAVEAKVAACRAESLQLDQCRLLHEHDVGGPESSLDDVAAATLQSLAALESSAGAEGAASRQLLHAAKALLHATEHAVRNLLAVRQRFPNLSPAASPASPLGGPDYFYAARLPSLPSPYLARRAAEFESSFSDCARRVVELEVLAEAGGDGRDVGSGGALQCLPAVVVNLHAFFIHIAARVKCPKPVARPAAAAPRYPVRSKKIANMELLAQVEALHQQVAAGKQAFLADRRRRGDPQDPFQDAQRREAARAESLQKARLGTLPNLIAGASVATAGSVPPGTSSAAAGGLFGGPSPVAFPSLANKSPSSVAPSSSMPLFGTSTIPSTAPSLMGLPSTPSIFGGASMPSLSSAITPAAASTPSLFGAPASPLASGTNLFGGAASGAGLFGTPAPSTSLFGTPVSASEGSGGTVTSLFGLGNATATTAAKSKPRGSTRRK